MLWFEAIKGMNVVDFKNLEQAFREKPVPAFSPPAAGSVRREAMKLPGRVVRKRLLLCFAEVSPEA